MSEERSAPTQTATRRYDDTYWAVATADSTTRWIAHGGRAFVSATAAQRYIKRHLKFGDWRVYRMDVHYAITEDNGVTHE